MNIHSQRERYAKGKNGISQGDWGSRFSIQKVLKTAGYYKLSWHPDGTKLVFTEWDNPDQEGSYISMLEFDKETIDKLPNDKEPAPDYTLIGEKELTKGDWEDFGPSFSPDGNKIVCNSLAS